jgi:hypothetical protein
MVVLEKARLEGMRRALRGVGVEEGRQSNGVFGARAAQERRERLKKMPPLPRADTRNL